MDSFTLVPIPIREVSGLPRFHTSFHFNGVSIISEKDFSQKGKRLASYLLECEDENEPNDDEVQE